MFLDDKNVSFDKGIYAVSFFFFFWFRARPRINENARHSSTLFFIVLLQLICLTCLEINIGNDQRVIRRESKTDSYSKDLLFLTCVAFCVITFEPIMI